MMRHLRAIHENQLEGQGDQQRGTRASKPSFYGGPAHQEEPTIGQAMSSGCPLRGYQSKYYSRNYPLAKEGLVVHGFATRTRSRGTLSGGKLKPRLGQLLQASELYGEQL